MNTFTCFFLQVLLKYSLISSSFFKIYRNLWGFFAIFFTEQPALIQMPDGYKRSYLLKETCLVAGWLVNVRPFITTRQLKD